VDRGLSSFLVAALQTAGDSSRLDSVPHLLQAARRQSGLAAHCYGLRPAALQTAGDSSRPDSVLHLLHAARRQSGLAAHSYGLRSLRSKSVSRYPISRVKLLEVPRVGGFSLGQNGHGFTVGLRPNPGKQGVDAIEAF
jgi:hypothetical protein